MDSNNTLQYRTTVGWSLITSGIVSFILTVLPGDSFWWGFSLLVIGIIVLFVRKT